MKNKKLTKEEFNKMLPPGYWESPCPEVGDKFFNTATMEWDIITRSESATYSKKEWFLMMVKRGRYTLKQAEKFFSDTEREEIEKLFNEKEEGDDNT